MENQDNIDEQGFTSAFSPLEENVTQRDYTKPKVQIEDIAAIDEPIIATPSFEELDNNFRNQLGEEDPSGSADPRTVWGAGGETGSANPYVENLDKKEQRMASKAMVEAILDGYSGLKKWSNNLIKLDPKKIKKGINDGDIDGNIMIPVGGGQQVPLMEYVEMYNAETSELITTSDEFKEKVSPVLLRVLMKRGIGMTDEQLLAYYFGMDIITTGAQIFALRGQNNALIAQLKEMSEGKTSPAPAPRAQSKEVEAEPEPEPRPTQRTPPPSSEPQTEFYEPEEVTAEPVQRAEQYTQYEVLDDLQPEVKPTRKKSRMVKTNVTPQFGADADILNHMEQLAREEAKKTPKTTTRNRKKK